MTKAGRMANSDAYPPKVENSDLEIDRGNRRKSQIGSSRSGTAFPDCFAAEFDDTKT